MLRLDHVDLIEYKTLRTNPDMRLLFSVGELDSETVKKIHEMRIKGSQKLSLIIVDTEDLEDLEDVKKEGPS
jgi:hypothetical protein